MTCDDTLACAASLYCPDIGIALGSSDKVRRRPSAKVIPRGNHVGGEGVEPIVVAGYQLGR